MKVKTYFVDGLVLDQDMVFFYSPKEGFSSRFYTQYLPGGIIPLGVAREYCVPSRGISGTEIILLDDRFLNDVMEDLIDAWKWEYAISNSLSETAVEAAIAERDAEAATFVAVDIDGIPEVETYGWADDLGPSIIGDTTWDGPRYIYSDHWGSGDSEITHRPLPAGKHLKGLLVPWMDDSRRRHLLHIPCPHGPNRVEILAAIK